VNRSALNKYAQLLTDTVDIFSVLVDPAVAPAPGSPAECELRATREQPAHTGVWGESPVRTAYALAAMSYSAALDQGRAMAALMTGGFTAVPVVVLARSLTEMTSQAWWLLDPGIGHIGRVRRLQALRYRSADEGQRAAAADGVPEDERYLYTETISQVGEYSRRLDLEAPSKDGRVYVCGSERLRSASRRVKYMFGEVDVAGVYNLYSAFSHGELFALWQGFEKTTEGSQHIHYRPAVNEESFKGAVAVASYALYAPAARAVSLFGLDQGSLEEWIDEHDAMVHPDM